MRKLARIGALLVSVGGLLGNTSQPAAAEEVAAVVYTALATVGGDDGIAFPCLPGALDTGGNVTDCPVLATEISTTNLPTVHHPLTYTQLNFHDGDSASIGFGTNATAFGNCLGVDVVAGLPLVHVAGAGDCSLGASGTIHGYCGLAEGFLTGFWNTTSTSVPQNANGNRTYLFTARFTSVATVAVLRGSVSNNTTGESGPLTGILNAVPIDPVSCFDNDQKNFLVAGVNVAVLR